MRQFHYGFTLIELMLVISIIGILAAVAIPAYQNYIKASKVAEGLVLVSSIEMAVADYYSYRGKFPLNNRAAGLPNPEKLRGKYVNRIEIENGAIHLTFDESIEGGRVTFRPTIAAVYPPTNALVWVCGYQPVLANMFAIGENKTTLDKSYLPTICLDSPRHQR
ncbi:MAG: prepilin-type N-terminal cleavage/methylation domain-containing protein [Thioploca sp.]|nr:prepilin-type N-terminal cleavage/methylation domain-containing protein [Thioploca sp.]